MLPPLSGIVDGVQTLEALKVLINPQEFLADAYNAPGSSDTRKGYAAIEDVQVEGSDKTASLPDSSKGPKYIATASGTVLETTSVAAKHVLEYAQSLSPTRVPGRETTPVHVAVAELQHAPGEKETVMAYERDTVTKTMGWIITASNAALAIACALTGDQVSFYMIALGMTCNTVASQLLRNGVFTYARPCPSQGAPPGDGYLVDDSGTDFVVLKGSEDAVVSITRSRFTFSPNNQTKLNSPSLGSSLLSYQVIAQILLFPFASAFGQFAFLLSMFVGWLYNAHLSQQERESWKQRVIKDVLKVPQMQRFKLGTRTTAAVFMMQVLKPKNVEEALAKIIPNKTPEWDAWRKAVAIQLAQDRPDFAGLDLPSPTTADSPPFTEDQKELLETLFADAQFAVEAYRVFEKVKSQDASSKDARS